MPRQPRELTTAGSSIELAGFETSSSSGSEWRCSAEAGQAVRASRAASWRCSLSGRLSLWRICAPSPPVRPGSSNGHARQQWACASHRWQSSELYLLRRASHVFGQPTRIARLAFGEPIIRALTSLDAQWLPWNNLSYTAPAAEVGVPELCDQDRALLNRA